MSEPRVQALEKNTVWQLNWAPERGEEESTTHHEPRQRRNLPEHKSFLVGNRDCPRSNNVVGGSTPRSGAHIDNAAHHCLRAPARGALTLHRIRG
jgi:hypothetical protein